MTRFKAGNCGASGHDKRKESFQMYLIQLGTIGLFTLMGAQHAIEMEIDIEQKHIWTDSFLEVHLLLKNPHDRTISLAVTDISVAFRSGDPDAARIADTNIYAFDFFTYDDRISLELGPFEVARCPVLINYYAPVPRTPGLYVIQVTCQFISPSKQFPEDRAQGATKWQDSANSSEIEIAAAPDETHRKAYFDVWTDLAAILAEVEPESRVQETEFFCDFLRAVGKIVYTTHPASLPYKEKLIESGTLDADIIYHLFYMLSLRPSTVVAEFVRDAATGRIEHTGRLTEYTRSVAHACASKLIRAGDRETKDILLPILGEEEPLFDIEAGPMHGRLDVVTWPNCPAITQGPAKERVF